MSRKKSIKGLADIVGKGWRISYDEAWKHEVHEEKMAHKIDYERVALRGGGFLRLFDLGKRMLTIWTPRYKWARTAAALHKDIILNDLDKEAELFFPFELAKLLLDSGHGQKRRALSEERKAQLTAVLAKARAARKDRGTPKT